MLEEFAGRVVRAAKAASTAVAGFDVEFALSIEAAIKDEFDGTSSAAKVAFALSAAALCRAALKIAMLLAALDAMAVTDEFALADVVIEVMVLDDKVAGTMTKADSVELAVADVSIWRVEDVGIERLVIEVASIEDKDTVLGVTAGDVVARSSLDDEVGVSVARLEASELVAGRVEIATVSSKGPTVAMTDTVGTEIARSLVETAI